MSLQSNLPSDNEQSRGLLFLLLDANFALQKTFEKNTRLYSYIIAVGTAGTLLRL